MKENEIAKCWYVMGAGRPTFKHPTRAAAEIEAERLARTNPGSVFEVLEIMSQYQVPTPPSIRKVAVEPVPF